MNIQEIRDRAPDGATHYDIQWGTVFYYQLDICVKIWNQIKFVYLDFIYNAYMYELKPLY